MAGGGLLFVIWQAGQKRWLLCCGPNDQRQVDIQLFRMRDRPSVVPARAHDIYLSHYKGGLLLLTTLLLDRGAS